MLDLDTTQINSFAIEWPRRIRDEDMYARRCTHYLGQYLMYTERQRRDRDRRYWTQFCIAIGNFFRLLEWKPADQ